MKNIIIVGGGISGLTAGILLQKAGLKTEIYEKNEVPGGLCSSFFKDGYTIDNCIHWLTGTNSQSALHPLLYELGALNDEIKLYKKQMFYSSSLNGKTVTFWRDKERTRRELTALSPEDKKEIDKLIDCTAISEKMVYPIDKPPETMNLADILKLVFSMRKMAKLKKEYRGVNLKDLSLRFKHPLIRTAITDYMPKDYGADAFLLCYATVTGENGDIPEGGSLAMSKRMAKTYEEAGGVLHLNSPVKSLIISDNRVLGINLSDGQSLSAQYVVCACDPSFTFKSLLPEKYMPEGLSQMYAQKQGYLARGAFQAAFAVDGDFDNFTGAHVFSCKNITVGKQVYNRLILQSYNYDPTFCPEGKSILQISFTQTEEDYFYWKALYENKAAYEAKKRETALLAMESITEEYPFLKGKIRLLDVWTPMSYSKRVNSYCGAYMGFLTSKHAKPVSGSRDIVNGLDNVFLAGQWMWGPGGLPSAMAAGKFAAERIINKYK